VAAVDLGRLNEADRLIQGVAREFGLDFLPQEFDVVPDQKMLQTIAYGLPVNFSHWSFGRNYESERTRYEHGYGVPYEVVFNSDPMRAYIMETNPFVIQVLVMAHVYAHNDFMKNSRHFQLTRRDMISSASEAAARFRQYEEDYGLEAVEKLIDAALAIQWNVDPDAETHPETEEQARERLFGWARAVPPRGAFEDLVPPRAEPSTVEKRELRHRTPPEPTVELLGYIMEHSPRPLAEWERDVMGVVRAQAQYFMPYRRTKIMNEGWATFWHEKIMQRLFADRFLDAEAHGIYNIYNARVKAHNPRSLNPYLLGHALFCDIEERWNKGRFGRVFEEASTAREREEWDQGLGAGRRKIFDVRRTYMDWFFVDEFLTRELVEELKLYLYVEHEREESYETVVEETDWRAVKRLLVATMMNWGVPKILLLDGNYQGSLQLYLQHSYEGLPLDEEYASKTLEHVFALWGRPVYLESREPHNGSTRRKLFVADGSGIHVRTE
jgi:stage V sporulation protein R